MENQSTQTFNKVTVFSVSLVLLLALGFAGNRPGLFGAASGMPVQPKQRLDLVRVPDAASGKMRYTQLSKNGIDGLVEALETRGAKVNLSEHEIEGRSSLHIKVDGMELSPVMTSCNHCEPIVFEY